MLKNVFINDTDTYLKRHNNEINYYCKLMNNNHIPPGT